MQRTTPEYNHLPEDFKVYVGADGSAINMPAPGYVERFLPVVNQYAEPNGGYIACYSKNEKTGVYSVGGGVFVVGLIRLPGKYIDRVFYPKGDETNDIGTEQALKDLCNETFPDSAPCWAGGDTGAWFGARIDSHDVRDDVAEIALANNLPATVDLRQWCSPVVNQGNINACTAHAATALVEYFEKRARNDAIAASRLFLYKITRNFLFQIGDTGANTRTTMKALATIGVPPEAFWAYDESKIDVEPSQFCYALACRYRSINYQRIDPLDRAKDVVLQTVKAILSTNRPVMFGVIAYLSCWKQFASSDRLPFPTPGDTLFGAHSMAVVGYDDSVITNNSDQGGVETVGAFLIKNSYGQEWGDQGYGWIPYDYLLKHKSIDWWTIWKQEWLDMEQFG